MHVIGYHLIPLSDSIMFNVGITTFIYVGGGQLCVEVINQSLVINGLTND